MLTQYCTELWRSYAVALTNDPPLRWSTRMTTRNIYRIYRNLTVCLWSSFSCLEFNLATFAFSDCPNPECNDAKCLRVYKCMHPVYLYCMRIHVCIYIPFPYLHFVPLFAVRENVSLCDIMRMKPSPTGSSHGNFTWAIAEYQKDPKSPVEFREPCKNISNNQNMLPKKRQLSQSEQLAISAISTCCLHLSTANWHRRDTIRYLDVLRIVHGTNMIK